MWEQIRSNRRKSVFLVFLMAALLGLLGLAIGEAWSPGGGGLFGLALAAGLWVIMALVAYAQGASILMALSGARKVSREDAPQLFNVVEEMLIASGMKTMPELYIIDTPAMNAFAAGRDPDHAAVAVTAGLLGRLNRDQLQGVIAHEMSHIVNRDVLFMTLLSVSMGVVVMLSEGFMRSLWYGGGRRRSRSSDGGQAQALLMVLALVFALLAPVLAQVIYFAASRRREYLADAGAAVMTRYPDGLASALELLGGSAAPKLEASRATAPLYIVNPLSSAKLSGLFSTHPPIGDRVRILRGMGGGGQVSYQGYQQAWTSVSGSGGMPASTLGLAAVPLRGASAPAATSEPQEARARKRAAYDTVRKAHQYKFIECPCGLRMKIPPAYKETTVTCPRCDRTHDLHKD